LVNLVGKLDLLIQKPIQIELTPEKKKQILEQLKGLEDKEELKEEDANKILEAFHAILKGDQASLELIGYRWPGTIPQAAEPPSPNPNPFKDDNNKKTVKSLQERLGK
jgi:hypothetical protein